MSVARSTRKSIVPGYSFVGNAARMGTIIPERVVERREALGISQSELARRIDVGQSSINRLESGETRSPRSLHVLAKALGTSPDYLLGETDDPTNEDVGGDTRVPYGAQSSADERIIEIPVIDLAYGMGATYLDDINPEVRSEPFPLSFIRRYTKAKAEDLVIADGLGDSMAPTIGSSDQMLIDRSIDTMRVADQIWAFSFGGMGMVKRLRARPDGSIAILSDNPAVPEDRAVDDELHLIGRVVAIVRKV